MGHDVIAIGEPMIEFNEGGGALPSGERRSLRGFGGDASNFAIAAARQGARVGFVTRLGADPHGAMIRALWAAEGVDDSLVPTDAVAPTGVYFVSHGPDGHRFSFARTGSAASRLDPADLPREAIASARLVHLSGISLAVSTSACDAGHAAIEVARGAGRLVSFDTNLRRALWPLPRARAIIMDAIGLADVALPSHDDVAALTGLTHPDAILDECLRRGAGLVALKLGARGALVGTPRERHRVPAFPVAALDATGAGDAFGGAFVARHLAGDAPLAAARYAAVAAALSTRGYGAVSPIPRRAEVEAALAGWTTRG